MSVSQLIRDTGWFDENPNNREDGINSLRLLGGAGTGAHYMSKKMEKIFTYIVDRARFPTMTGYGPT